MRLQILLQKLKSIALLLRVNTSVQTNKTDFVIAYKGFNIQETSKDKREREYQSIRLIAVRNWYLIHRPRKDESKVEIGGI